MKWVKILADTKIKFDRGQALSGLFKNLIILTAGFKILFPQITFIGLIWIGIGIAVALYLGGLIDLRWIKVYQAEQNLNTGKYNPYFVKLVKRKNI